jgi:hypothetical protein
VARLQFVFEKLLAREIVNMLVDLCEVVLPLDPILKVKITSFFSRKFIYTNCVVQLTNL